MALLDDILEFSKQKAVFDLLESGVDASFLMPMLDRLQSSVVTGGSLDTLFDELKIFIEGDSENLGTLDRYVGQVMNDSIRQFQATYMETLSEDLGFQFYKYVGTKIQRTRPFCDKYMNRVFHKEEVKMLGEGRDPDTGKMFSPDLHQGRIKGTNENNIFTNRGGWNCRHVFTPLAESLVPKSDIERAIEKGYIEEK